MMQIPARMTAAAITGVAKAITGARSVWLGCNPVPVQRIYFANHSSHSDFVLLWAALPPLLRKRTRPVAGADYWSKGAIRPFVIHQVFNGVLVERNSTAAATDTTATTPAAATTTDQTTAATPTSAPFAAATPLPPDAWSDASADPLAGSDTNNVPPDFAWREHDPVNSANQQDAAAIAALSQSDSVEQASANAWREADPSAADAAFETDFRADAPEPHIFASNAAADASTPPKPDALAPLKAALDAGDSLIIFPEGTRNMQEGLLPFKSGLYHLAKAYPHVEIVPVWLGNLNRVMPKGALIPLPLLCTVSFGTPLQVHTGESKEGFLSRARNALLQLAGVEGEVSAPAAAHNAPERTAP